MQHVDIHSHLNAPKLRIDTWNTLAALGNEVHYANDVDKIKSFEKDIKQCLDILKPIECYHAFPGIDLCNKIEMLYYKNEFEKFHEIISLILQALRSNTCNYKALLNILRSEDINHEEFILNTETPGLHYFEVLFVEDVSDTRKEILKKEMESYSEADDRFVYEIVFVNSFEDAIIATMFNFNIKTVLISDFFRYSSTSQVDAFQHIIKKAQVISQNTNMENIQGSHASELCNIIRNLRENDLDIYYLSSHEPEKSAANKSNSFNKIFYDYENYFELHLTILHGLASRYETPFFDALKKYAHEPKSTFHALPIARGKSVFNSRWIHDMQDFYGKNIFLAESSATAGGLDSLMNPIGSIKHAMEKAAHYFGSHETFFVTSGTSASNKIVLQALLNPGDIILIEHSCHESHHYGIILTGAHPIFLNGYHVDHCDISGPVSLRTIKEQLLTLKKQNMLDRVKLLVLTNCTFDGLVYNVQRYMEEILAIKPDMIFLWDEAWFAYARCVPHYRLRTAMYVAANLEKKYRDPAYREEYKKFKKELDKHKDNDEFILNNPLLPDPDKVKIRVYSTQSTHKTLSCFRQGSMIHMFDHSFDKIREKFTHSFITHSTTSPNYQLIATMDLARRQALLEGFELVQNAIELAMIFRQQVNNHPLINGYFQAVGPSELIPEEFRQSHVVSGYDANKDWATVEKAWITDDIVIDPTRVTLISKTHLSGYTMKSLLMNRFGIQVNKVSLNSILIQFNIGTLRSSVSYLLDSLFTLCNELQSNQISHPITQKHQLPLTPDFSYFSTEFVAYKNTDAGKLREAFYAGQEEDRVESASIHEILQRIKSGDEVVASSIVIPVPPGYPALLPGQVITESILQYLSVIDPSSVIGGYSATHGLKIFKRKK